MNAKCKHLRTTLPYPERHFQILSTPAVHALEEIEDGVRENGPQSKHES